MFGYLLLDIIWSSKIASCLRKTANLPLGTDNVKTRQLNCHLRRTLCCQILTLSLKEAFKALLISTYLVNMIDW